MFLQYLDYMKNKENIARAKKSYSDRHGGVQPTKSQLTKELEMGYNLRRAGVSEEGRQKFFDEYINNEDARNEARATVGENASEEVVNDELERRFEIKIKVGESIKSERDLTEHIKSSKQFLKDNQQIDNPSSGQVYTEVKHRLSVRDSYHVSEGSVKEINDKISEIRREEERFVKRSSDKNGARAVIAEQRRQINEAIEQNASPAEVKEKISKAKYQRDFLSKYSSREMKDEKIMKKAEKDIITKLGKIDGSLSPEYRKEFAHDVIEESKSFAGIE